jgi:hypothetical protein
MHYQITRGGQTYGPYTLADLQRYVASGHVLPTDLAKSDEMAEWLPVSQILNPAGTPPPAPPTAPYTAAPTTGYAASAYPAPAYPGAGDQFSDPPNLHWGLVLLFDLLTCYVFQIVWNFVIAIWMKRVQRNSQAVIYYAVGYGLALFQTAFVWPTIIITLHGGTPVTHPGLQILGVISLIIRIVGHFNMKSSLEEHYNTVEPMGLRVNGILVFFFGGLYLQSQLNRVNEIKRAMRYQSFAR